MMSSSVAATWTLFAAFLASLFFYGTGTNLVMLAVAAGLLLLSASMSCPHGIRRAWQNNAVCVLLASAALIVLLLNFQWSLSKDSSFAPTWVLAAAPMTIVIALGFDAADRQRLWRALVLVGCVLASISLTRLLVYGERARLPFVDPNNYASLLYLLWIPFVHGRLAAQWVGERAPTGARILEFIASFLLLAALFATQSRAGAFIVGAVLMTWLAFAGLRRQPLAGALGQIAIAAAAFALVLVATPSDLIGERVASFAMGVGVRADLIEAGWRMFIDYPLSGVGAFCFSLMYAAYRQPSEQVTAGLFVHNDYVQLLAEGGVLLLAPVLVLACSATVRLARGVRATVDSADFRAVGCWLAIGAACAHALVNFVFYSLPLMILLGVLIAQAVRAHPVPVLFSSVRTIVPAAAAMLVFGWLSFGYLLLDLATVAVFQGQAGVPFAESIRKDASAQLHYARLAQRLNGARGVPALAEAMLLTRQLDVAGGTQVVVERALSQYRKAIAVDPWNPLAYTAFASFVMRHGEGLPLQTREAPEALLLSGLGLDPTDVPAIEGLLQLNASRRRFGDSYAMLKSIVYPWLELLKRRDADAADRYLAEMMRLAKLAGDTAFETALEAKQRALESVRPSQRDLWFHSPRLGTQPAALVSSEA